MSYNDTQCDAKARRLAKERAIKAKAEELYRNSDPAEIRAKYFKDYGCINFCSTEFYEKLQLARDLHDIDEKLHPELHDTHEEEPYRCYHKTVCKCGFSEAYDSGD